MGFRIIPLSFFGGPDMKGGIFTTRRAFTLVELLVVIAIIGILATILLPVVHRVRCAAKEGASRALIRTLETAITTYKKDWGEYPTDDNGEGSRMLFTALTTTELGGPYHHFKPKNIYQNNQGILDEMGDMRMLGAVPRSVLRYDRANQLPDPNLILQHRYDLWSMAGCIEIQTKNDAVIRNW